MGSFYLLRCQKRRKYSQAVSLFFALLGSGLNLLNFLHTAFTRADPKIIKKTVKLSIFFTLSRSTSVIAAPKMLVKLTQGVKIKEKEEKEGK